MFLNLLQCLACSCWAGLWLLLRPPRSGAAPARLFWRPALSNAVGPALGVVALKNIRRATLLCADIFEKLMRKQLHCTGAGQIVQTHPGHDCWHAASRQALQLRRICGCRVNRRYAIQRGDSSTRFDAGISQPASGCSHSQKIAALCWESLLRQTLPPDMCSSWSTLYWTHTPTRPRTGCACVHASLRTRRSRDLCDR